MSDIRTVLVKYNVKCTYFEERHLRTDKTVNFLRNHASLPDLKRSDLSGVVFTTSESIIFGKNISRFILLICELRLKYKCEENSYYCVRASHYNNSQSYCYIIVLVFLKRIEETLSLDFFFLSLCIVIIVSKSHLKPLKTPTPFVAAEGCNRQCTCSI